MVNQEETTTASQPVEADTSVDGLEDIANLIQAKLSTEPEPTESEEPTEPEPQPDTVKEPQEPELAEGEPPAKVPGWQKRIDKLTAKYKDAEEQLQDLRQQLHDATKNQKNHGETNSISELVNRANSELELDDLHDQALSAEKFAKQALRRYRRDPDAVERELQQQYGQAPEDVEDFLENLISNAEWSRESDIPKRRKQLATQAKHFEHAAQRYPQLKDERSSSRAWVDRALQVHGDTPLKQIPEVHLMLMRALCGQQLEQLQDQKPKQTRKTPDPTPQPGKPAQQKAPLSRNAQAAQEAKARMMKSGSKDDAAAYIMAAFS